MTRLVVYVRSSFCPDVAHWRRWVDENSIEYVEFDIDRDEEAHHRVLAWTGHESVPTLVIAPDDDIAPFEEPSPLPSGHGPRAVDRGTMLTEPNTGQIAPVLDRHGILYGDQTEASDEPVAAAASGDDANRAEKRPWWRLG